MRKTFIKDDRCMSRLFFFLFSGRRPWKVNNTRIRFEYWYQSGFVCTVLSLRSWDAIYDASMIFRFYKYFLLVVHTLREPYNCLYDFNINTYGLAVSYVTLISGLNIMGSNCPMLPSPLKLKELR